MTMHWTERQHAIVHIGEELQRRGWTIFGYDPGESHAMTDYYRAAHWSGVATCPAYPGVVVGVAVSDYAAKNSGEENWPVFHETPDRRAWHVEFAGRIIETGVGLQACAHSGEEGRKGAKKVVDQIEAAAGRARKGESAPVAEQTGSGFTVQHERGWTWVNFPVKPDRMVLDGLKEAGFRWSKKRFAWYSTQTIGTETIEAIVKAAERFKVEYGEIENAPAAETPAEPTPKIHTVTPAEAAARCQRDLNLPQYIVAMSDVDRLPFTTDDYSRIEVYCMGRDVELTTSEIVTIGGFTQYRGEFYIHPIQPGENFVAAGDKLPADIDNRWVWRERIYGVLLDEAQVTSLETAIPLLSGMVKSWESAAAPRAEPPAQPVYAAGFVPGKGDAFDYIPSWMAPHIPKLYAAEKALKQGETPLAYIKIFTPDSNWTHWLMEWDGEDTCFGLVQGLDTEIGYFSLSELRAGQGHYGLRLEREIWTAPLPVNETPEYIENWGDGGLYPKRTSKPKEPEPWEISQHTYQLARAKTAGGVPILNGADGDEHKRLVRQALEAGKPVPAFVLTDYPGLLEAEPLALAAPQLPAGWTEEDICFLIGKLDEGVRVLVADTKLGIPTIHDSFGVEARFCGFGLFVVETAEYKLTFDGGGAMDRTPSGKGWSKLRVDHGEYPYDFAGVRAKLQSYLPAPEIWQMTEAEFLERSRQEQEGGKEAPANVLADYPHLAAGTQAAIEEETAAPAPQPSLPVVSHRSAGDSFDDLDAEFAGEPETPAAEPPDLETVIAEALVGPQPIQPAPAVETPTVPVFRKQLTGDAADALLRHAASLVPEMSGFGDETQAPTAEPVATAPDTDGAAVFSRWELELTTGRVDKRSSAFYQALQAIYNPGALQIALGCINGDKARRAAIEKRIAALAVGGQA